VEYGLSEEEMAVRIRLARHGTTNRPFYRIVAANSQSPRDGRYIELLGTYDALQDPAAVALKPERIKYWLSVGAKASDTVKSIFKRHMQD
jgi:small subunit ribosomal protein S16